MAGLAKYPQMALYSQIKVVEVSWIYLLYK